MIAVNFISLIFSSVRYQKAEWIKITLVHTTLTKPCSFDSVCSDRQP